jgi:DNA-binding transcriptional LysR family regulator
MVAMISTGHRLAGEERIALKQLAKDAWTAPSPNGIVVNACRAAGFEPRLALVTRDTLAVRAIAAQGLAVTITPSLLARIGLPGVATPALKGRAPRRSIYALVPEAGAHPLADALTAALAEAA